MPGRLFLTRSSADLNYSGDIPELGLRQNIAPGEDLAVLEGARLVQMRWGMLPVARVNARGRPVMETIINVRGETIFSKSAFEGTRRVVVPVEGWYEWTGQKRKKTAWRITPMDGGLLYFAAIADTWNGPGGIKLDQVATVTCEPNDDLRRIHHRMGVLLSPEEIPIWIGPDQTQAARLIQPSPNGRLDISEAHDVDWSKP